MLQSQMLWEDIRRYHQNADTRDLSRVVGAMGTDRLIDELVDLLNTEDVDKVWITCRAIMDLIIVVRDDDQIADFQRAYHGSAIVTELERLAHEGRRGVRSNAIYTLGKTCCTGSVPTLIDVFRSSMQSDPLVLPQVLFEICWLDRSRLGGVGGRNASESVVSHPMGLPAISSWGGDCVRAPVERPARPRPCGSGLSASPSND